MAPEARMTRTIREEVPCFFALILVSGSISTAVTLRKHEIGTYFIGGLEFAHSS